MSEHADLGRAAGFELPKQPAGVGEHTIDRVRRGLSEHQPHQLAVVTSISAISSGSGTSRPATKLGATAPAS